MYTVLAVPGLFDLHVSSLLVKAEREHAFVRCSACFGFSRLPTTLQPARELAGCVCQEQALSGLHHCWLSLAAQTSLAYVPDVVETLSLFLEPLRPK